MKQFNYIQYLKQWLLLMAILIPLSFIGGFTCAMIKDYL